MRIVAYSISLLAVGFYNSNVLHILALVFALFYAAVITFYFTIKEKKNSDQAMFKLLYGHSSKVVVSVMLAVIINDLVLYFIYYGHR